MSEEFHPRGIGLNWLPCCICGPSSGRALKSDMSSFVADRESGLRVAAMFEDAGMFGWLDYRPSEPQWVQFKLGACARHLAVLERLANLVSKNGSILTPEIIAAAKAEME